MIEDSSTNFKFRTNYMKLGERIEMLKKTVSGTLLTLLLIGMLTPGFQRQLVSGSIVTPSEYTLGYYETIETVPAGSVVIMSFDLGPAGLPELSKMCVATMQHLFWRIHEAGIKVVLLCYWATGAALIVNCFEGMYGPMDQMGAVYGEDWVNLGYIAGGEVGMSNFAMDAWGAKPTDYQGTLVSTIPLMQNVHTIQDIYMLVSIESGTPGLEEYLRQWWIRNNGLKIIVGCLSVMKPGVIPYYSSGHVKGILAGFKEYVEYEWLLVMNYGYEPTVIPAIVGVEAGVWVKYGNITTSWSSNDPEAKRPDSLNIEWINNTVQTVYRNITFQYVIHYKNDTETMDRACIHLYTGEGNGTFWFVSAGLIPCESIYASPEWTDWKINETVYKTYAGVTRDTNYLTMTQSQIIPNDPLQNITLSVDYYWNKVTGVLTEYQELFLNQTGSYTTSWSLSYRIVNTNLWTTIDVPVDYSTIQEAIEAAKPGDSIHVQEGTYLEHITIRESIMLVGEDSRTTFIDGTGDGTVITICAQDVEISGFTVRNGERGVVVEGYFRGSIIQGNTISNNTYSGISVWYGNNNIMKENIIVSNGLPNEWGYGIELRESHNNFVYNNTITNNWYGTRLIYSSANTLSYNNMTDNHFNFGLYVWTNSLAHFIQNIDASNTVNGKPIHYLINQHNLTIDPTTFPSIGYLGIVNSTNIVVKNINTSKVGEGVLFAWTNNSTIENMQTSNNHYGFALVFSNSNMISENTVESIYHTGIRVFSSNNNTVVANRIINSSGYGFVAHALNSSTISRNTVSNCGYGIGLTFSFNNKIDGNTLKNSSDFGIILSASSYNHIFHNNFINNTNQAVSYDSINTWDDGYPSSGNYWSDYAGVDFYSGPYQNETGSDGIGDTPYVIDADNQDHYPLKKPYPWDPHDIGITSITTSKTIVAQGYTLQINVTIMNYGKYTESFNVSVFYDETVIIRSEGKNYTTTTLPSGNSTTLTLTWNTTDVAKGNHTITAEATQLLGETDILDNNMTDGIVYVGIPGDVNADGKVNVKDIFAVAKAFGSELGQPRYDPNLDINNDGKINVKDIFTTARNFGKEDP